MSDVVDLGDKHATYSTKLLELIVECQGIRRVRSAPCPPQSDWT